MSNSKTNKTEVNKRQNRLKSALKANMAKRKSQVKARSLTTSEKVSRKDKIWPLYWLEEVVL